MGRKLSGKLINKMPHSLRGNFTLITIILMLVFGIGTATMSFIMFSDSLRRNSIHSAESNLQFIRNDINSDLNSILGFCRWCRTNTAISSYIAASPEDPYYNTLTKEASERLSEQYLSTSAYPYISRVIITNSENSKFLQKNSSSYYSSDRYILEVLKKLPYYKQLLNAPDYTFHVGVQKDPFVHASEKILPIIRPIESSYSDDEIGVLFMQISLSMFTDPLSRFSSQEHTPIYLTISDESYCIDNGKITSISLPKSSEELQYDDMVSSSTRIEKISGSGYSGLYVTSPIEAEGCYITMPVVTDGARQSVSGFFFIVFFILLIVMIIGVLLMRFLSYSVTQPVACLKNQLSLIAGGDFSQNPEIEWDNELGDIGRDVNLLATDISNLMEQRITDEKQKKDLEYQILQSQINPHFLYNTLNSIKWMATAQHSSGIAEMTTALAHLLKSISKGTKAIVSMKEEFQLLDDYFTIQKYRYGGAITMDYQIDDPDLIHNQILRFTLQPIVENSIFHGIEPKGSSGHIDIHLYHTENDSIQVDITDDGVGMDQAMISSVLAGETSDRSSFFKQIGIGSVNKRIQYTFGSEYGISITSTPGEFTCTSILLPHKKQDKQQ